MITICYSLLSPSKCWPPEVENKLESYLHKIVPMTPARDKIIVTFLLKLHHMKTSYLKASYWSELALQPFFFFFYNRITTLRPLSIRRWGMGKGKSEKIFFAPPPPLSFLLPIAHPLGRSFFLSPVFHCLKNSRWEEN